MSTCAIDGCAKPIFIKKSRLCNGHATREYRYGSADLPDLRKRAATVEITCAHAPCAAVFIHSKPRRPRFCPDCSAKRVWHTYPRKPKAPLVATVTACECGAEFTAAAYRRRKYCDQCSATRAWTRTGNSFMVKCSDCGEIKRTSGAPRKQDTIYTCRDCRRKRPSTRCTGNALQRARFWGVEYEPIDKRRVYVRDNWRCGICKRPVDKRLKHPDPQSASLDHIVPISCGGGHTYANTQCSHLGCNTAKQAGGHGEQLALIG